jgi:signal transduction histidine kinase/CheY-like chemotaxis protein
MKRKIFLTCYRLGLEINNPQWWLQVLSFAIAYPLFGWFIITKIPMTSYGSPVWPGAGFVIAALLRWGYSRWLGIFLGALIMGAIVYGNNLSTHLPALILESISMTLWNILFVKLIRRLTKTKYPFETINHVVIFIAISLFCIAFLNAFIGTGFLLAGKLITGSKFLLTLVSWWIGDAIGILVFAPLCLILPHKPKFPARKSWLSAEFFITLIFLGVIIYFSLIQTQPIEYLLLLPLLWSVFRFGQRVTTILVTGLASIAAIATAYQRGVFYQVSLESNSLILLQLFVGVLCITTMVMAAVVSENRQAAFELQQINAELENRVLTRTLALQESEAIAQKLALEAKTANQAKSTFIANMSHELRSPLNAILGFSQIMLRTKSLPPEQYENAGIIHRSGEYLLTLINNVLDFAKIEAGKTTLNEKDFDLYQLLDDLEDMLNLRAVNAGLELIFDRAENLPRYIYGDGVKLRQVLLNLLGNGIKFTEKGGVVLRVNAIFHENTENYTLDFNINDTGVGIAPAELSQLFEAFSQTKSGQEAHEGTGLGLAISRQFVQLMGGNITVSSQLGEGTTFQFAIEVQPGQTINSDRNINEKRVIGLTPDQPIYKILVVDDKLINCQLLIKLLTPLGFDLQAASNGQEAIKIWDEWQPNLIFMDMRMPVMDGYEATKYIKGHVKGSATVIIALTASVLEEEKAIVLSAGCDDFMRKPFKEEAIFNMLHQYLGVNYIYQEIIKSVIDQRAEILTFADLQIMPQDWLERFMQRNLEADASQVLMIMQEIPPTETKLIKGLTKLVYEYEFEKIINLIEPLIIDQK